ncbi:MAG: type II secretion system inner membrane protein GspF [Deltaproteobacteria bacterium]|nr:type II secretion system inner membrane protein GspF [Deltaproteobacteria bacterium]
MPVFAYKGVDGRGRTVSGAKDADSPKVLRALLRREGILVTDVAEARAGTAAVAGQGKGLRREVHFGKMFERIKRTEVAAFTRQLSTLLKAGIPLAEALGALFEQIENDKLKTTVGDVRMRVNEGSSLADSLSRHGTVFEDLYVSMVRAGEAAGNLDQVLSRLADFLEAQAKLKNRVLSALAYPAVMVVVSVAVMSVLMVAVVPQITQLFEDAETSLPWNTEMLIWVSHVIGAYWYAWLALLPLAIYGLIKWTRSAKGRPRWDRIKLRAVLFGPLVRQIAVGRFARTLGTMLSSGVPLLKALDISKDILENVVLVKVIEAAREQIQQGESIAVALRKSGEFPPVVTHMIAVGERSGQLEEMLGNVATAYEAEVEMKLGRLTSLLEPLIIVVMGGTVAFIVFSILMPIMQMNTLVQ